MKTYFQLIVLGCTLNNTLDLLLISTLSDLIAFFSAKHRNKKLDGICCLKTATEAYKSNVGRTGCMSANKEQHEIEITLDPKFVYKWAPWSELQEMTILSK